MSSAVLLVSDMHVGRRTSDYNLDVFEMRFENMKHNVLSIAKRHRVENLYICLLGDIVDGEEIYRGHGYEKETTVIEEVDILLDMFCRMLGQFLNTFKLLKVYCVKGNHGRSNRYGSGKANWDSVFYRLLKEAMDDEMVIEYTDDWYMMARIGHWKFMLTHGDCIRMYQNVPYYGVVRNIMRWQTGVLGRFDVCCMGHFHTVARFFVNNCEVIMNGTMLSGDEYVERIGLMPVTKYVMFGVGRSSPITWMECVDLEKRI